jgi:hypothetical protein
MWFMVVVALVILVPLFWSVILIAPDVGFGCL